MEIATRRRTKIVSDLNRCFLRRTRFINFLVRAP